MLGSAIPRRWFLSLALVGLVSIFAASYATGWSNPAYAADSEGTGPGGNSVVLTPEEVLDQIDTLPTSLTLQSGQQLSVTLNTFDGNGNPNAFEPASTFNITYLWSIMSGSGVTLSGATNERTVVIQANSPGVTVVRADVDQIRQTTDSFFIREMTITVVAPGIPPTTPASPTNPGTPPASIPNSKGVVTPEGSILVSTTGVETGNSPESQALGSRPVVLVQNGSVNNFYGVNISDVDPSGLREMPARFLPGSSAADITFVNEAGVAQNNFRLMRSARVCLPTSSSDRANGITNIRVLRDNAAIGQWVELTSTYNTITRQVCANSSNFSTFAIGVLQLAATPGPEGNLPATGGWSPSSGLLLFAGLFGFVMVGGGVVSMRRARSVRPD